jgi:hypothetical protein
MYLIIHISNNFKDLYSVMVELFSPGYDANYKEVRMSLDDGGDK